MKTALLPAAAAAKTAAAAAALKTGKAQPVKDKPQAPLPAKPPLNDKAASAPSAAAPKGGIASKPFAAPPPAASKTAAAPAGVTPAAASTKATTPTEIERKLPAVVKPSVPVGKLPVLPPATGGQPPMGTHGIQPPLVPAKKAAPGPPAAAAKPPLPPPVGLAKPGVVGSAIGKPHLPAPGGAANPRPLEAAAKPLPTTAVVKPVLASAAPTKPSPSAAHSKPPLAGAAKPAIPPSATAAAAKPPPAPAVGVKPPPAAIPAVKPPPVPAVGVKPPAIDVKPKPPLAVGVKPPLAPTAGMKPPPVVGAELPIAVGAKVAPAPGVAKAAVVTPPPPLTPAVATGGDAKPAFAPGFPGKPAPAPVTPGKPTLPDVAKPAIPPDAAAVTKLPLGLPGDAAKLAGAPLKPAIGGPSVAASAPGLAPAGPPQPVVAAPVVATKTLDAPSVPAPAKPLVGIAAELPITAPGVNKPAITTAAKAVVSGVKPGTGRPAAAPVATAKTVAAAAPGKVQPSLAEASVENPPLQQQPTVPLAKKGAPAPARPDEGPKDMASVKIAPAVEAPSSKEAGAGITAKDEAAPEEVKKAVEARESIQTGRARGVGEEHGESERSSTIETSASERRWQPWTRPARQRGAAASRRRSSSSRRRRYPRRGSSIEESEEYSDSARRQRRKAAPRFDEISSSTSSSSVSEVPPSYPRRVPQQLDKRTRRKRVSSPRGDRRRGKRPAEPFSPRLPPSFMHTATAAKIAYEAAVAAGTASRSPSAPGRRHRGALQMWSRPPPTQCDRVYLRRQPREGTQIIYVTAHLESLLLRLFVTYSYNLYMTETRWIRMCVDTGLFLDSEKDPDVLKYIFRGVVQHKGFCLAEFDELLQLLVRLARYKFRKHSSAITEEGALNAVIAQLLRGAAHVFGVSSNPEGHPLQECGIQVCCETQEKGICCIPPCRTVCIQTTNEGFESVGVQAEPAVSHQGVEVAASQRCAATNTPQYTVATTATQTDPLPVEREVVCAEKQADEELERKRILEAAGQLRRREEHAKRRAARSRATQTSIYDLDEDVGRTLRAKRDAWRAWRKLRQCVALEGHDESRLFTVFCNYSEYDRRELQNLMSEKRCAELCRDSHIVSVASPTHPSKGVSPDEAERLYHLLLGCRPSGILLLQEQQAQPLLRSSSSCSLDFDISEEEFEQEKASEEEESDEAARKASLLGGNSRIWQQQQPEAANANKQQQLGAGQWDSSTQQKAEDKLDASTQQQKGKAPPFDASQTPKQPPNIVAVEQTKKVTTTRSSGKGEPTEGAAGVSCRLPQAAPAPAIPKSAAIPPTVGKQTFSKEAAHDSGGSGPPPFKTSGEQVKKPAAGAVADSGGASAAVQTKTASDPKAPERRVAAVDTTGPTQKAGTKDPSAFKPSKQDTRLTYVEFKGLLYYLGSRMYQDLRPRTAFQYIVRKHVVYYCFADVSSPVEEERRESRERQERGARRMAGGQECYADFVGYEENMAPEAYVDYDQAPQERVSIDNEDDDASYSKASDTSSDEEDEDDDDEESYEDDEEDAEERPPRRERALAPGPMHPMYNAAPPGFQLHFPYLARGPFPPPFFKPCSS